MGVCFSHSLSERGHATKHAIVLWDIENLVPPANVRIDDVLAYVRNHYVVQAGYTERRTVCSVTTSFLSSFLNKGRVEDDLASSAMTVLLASAIHDKRDADFVLKRELMTFMADHIWCPEACRIVLMTSDADFVGVVDMALKLGFDVQLIVFGPQCGRQLLALPLVNIPVQWEDVLRACGGGPGLQHGDIQSAPLPKKKMNQYTQTMMLMNDSGVCLPVIFEDYPFEVGSYVPNSLTDQCLTAKS